MVLRIIETVQDGPVRLPIDMEARFVPGQAAQMNYEQITCGVSDGTRPLGLIDDLKNKYIDSTEPGGLVNVWIQRMVFRTDQYEVLEGSDITSLYKTGALLYVNSEGFLSNKGLTKESLAVGRVISVLEINHAHERNIIECIWF